MVEQIKLVDGETLLPLPAHILAAASLQPGDRTDVTIMGQSLVVQLHDAEPVGSDFLQTFKGVLERRSSAYQDLGQGYGDSDATKH